ncbi:CRISPR-associated endonuclease Cas1 [Synechococcus sp. PCC 7502]|uniref:CRISPR-associated endonuclease Cas1 n=1 Tax=Synechococcus sp. PCC 7502 TaxID=1173263 RepID=UPI00029FAC7B|nr:CRISPR-associated endonuclease Cas1 [Synechococcus sp. PCC 7502]AFY74776.1 CRISPR-associated endonuclease Cas1 [Synechococcus sp. PCC 7502]
MRSLYISQQGCYISLKQEQIIIKQGENILDKVQIPLLEQILIFGKSQVTTQVITTCLQRDIPIAYLSRMGYCYGRVIAIERGYRQLSRYQQQLSILERLLIARQIVNAKIKNSRVILQRQNRRKASEHLCSTIQSLDYLCDRTFQVETTDQLLGIEGAAAAAYFSAFSECIDNPEFVFSARTRRPPGNPVNAMLSFGYQVLWNHILALVELQGLDPYHACLHQSSEKHAALASDLIEEFRAPIVDSLVLYLVNRGVINLGSDFEYRDGGCYLNDSGRKKYLKAFIQRMEQSLQTDSGEQPRWDTLTQQIRAYKNCVYEPTMTYKPYLIR